MNRRQKKRIRPSNHDTVWCEKDFTLVKSFQAIIEFKRMQETLFQIFLWRNMEWNLYGKKIYINYANHLILYKIFLSSPLWDPFSKSWSKHTNILYIILDNWKRPVGMSDGMSVIFFSSVFSWWGDKLSCYGRKQHLFIMQ